MFLKFFTRKPEFALFEMTAADCSDVARLHGERFARGWGDGEFYGLLTQQTVRGTVARQVNASGSQLGGFVLTRTAGGEGEILTVAVSDRHAGLGLGWRLMQAGLQSIKAQGGDSVFLEVDEGNQPALKLYRKLGFAKVGERRGYYELADGKKSLALVMRLDLR